MRERERERLNAGVNEGPTLQGGTQGGVMEHGYGTSAPTSCQRWVLLVSRLGEDPDRTLWTQL